MNKRVEKNNIVSPVVDYARELDRLINEEHFRIVRIKSLIDESLKAVRETGRIIGGMQVDEV